MKDFLKAYKLYMTANFTPSLLAFSSFFLFISLVIIIVSGLMGGMESAKDYTSCLQLAGVLHIGLFSNVILSGVLSSLKFFHSTQFAKKYFTIIKAFSILSVCVVYDLILFVAAILFVGIDFAFDLIIYNAVATSIICVVYGTISLEMKYSTYGLLLWFLFCFGGYKIPENIFPDKCGLGLPVYADVAIVTGLYVATLIVTTALLTHWWNKSGRSFKIEPQKNVLVVGNK